MLNILLFAAKLLYPKMDSDEVTTEFIYFYLPPEVKPEDSSNSKGKELLDLFQKTKQQKGYSWSAWGRADEDKNSVLWVIGKC